MWIQFVAVKIAGDIDIIRSDAYCLSSISPKGSYTKRRKRVLLRSLNSGLLTERQATYYNFIIKKAGLGDILSKPFSFSKGMVPDREVYAAIRKY